VRSAFISGEVCFSFVSLKGTFASLGIKNEKILKLFWFYQCDLRSSAVRFAFAGLLKNSGAGRDPSLPLGIKTKAAGK
jgi:hypothetical protein